MTTRLVLCEEGESPDEISGALFSVSALWTSSSEAITDTVELSQKLLAVTQCCPQTCVNEHAYFLSCNSHVAFWSSLIGWFESRVRMATNPAHYLFTSSRLQQAPQI
jgi:hypothetical protein